MNVPIGCPPTNCVAEIRMDDHGNPFGELTPFVHFFGEVPKSGTKLYIYAEPKELSDEELDEIWARHVMHPQFDCVHLLRDCIAADRANLLRKAITADRKLRGGA